LIALANPLLSIVTVTRNCVDTLGQTLRSVQAVKGEDVEYLIVDGASDDGTLELIGRYGLLVDRLVSEPDNGIYHAMNKAIALARGDYVLFINGDDELIAAGFPGVIRALRACAGDVVCATTEVEASIWGSDPLVATPWRLPFHNAVPHSSAFVARSLLEKYRFREDLQIAADYDLFLRLFLDRKKFFIVDEATALHHRGGVSGDVGLSGDEVEQVKRERLKWLYPVVNFAMGLNRLRKQIFNGAQHGKG